MFQFNVEGQTQANTQQDRPKVDYDALNAHIVEAIGASESPEAVIGVVSSVVDLGLHAQPDAKMVFTGDAEAEKAELEKNPNQYFETLPDDKGVMTRYKRWATKPQQMVAITIDFPDQMVNRGQFFGDESAEAHPYRMLLNNEFYQKGLGKIVGKPYSLKETRDDTGNWSLKNNTILFKLGQAVGVLDHKGLMKPAYLGNLLGKAAMFNVHVFLNEHEGKKYLNEKISFNGPVPKAMQKMVPTLDPKYIFGVNFKGKQDPEVLKNLRQSVINTMSLALNFEGSDLQKALIEIGKIQPKGDSAVESVSQETKVPVQKQAAQPTPEDNFDEQDLPF